jgi:hypothetical protein
LLVASCAKTNKEYKAGPLGPVIENAEAFGKALGCMALLVLVEKAKSK